jgi:hypothetical protein
MAVLEAPKAITVHETSKGLTFVRGDGTAIDEAEFIRAYHSSTGRDDLDHELAAKLSQQRKLVAVATGVGATALGTAMVGLSLRSNANDSTSGKEFVYGLAMIAGGVLMVGCRGTMTSNGKCHDIDWPERAHLDRERADHYVSIYNEAI